MALKQHGSEIKWRPGRATHYFIFGIELNNSHPGFSIAQEAFQAFANSPGSYIAFFFISLGFSLACRIGGFAGQNGKLNPPAPEGNAFVACTTAPGSTNSKSENLN